jgi:hypothetical protein
MTVQSINPHSAVLYLSREELRAQGISSHQLSARHALSLARRAFHQAGLSPRGTMELETFPEPHGVLIFARLPAPARSGWRYAPAHRAARRRRL